MSLGFGIKMGTGRTYCRLCHNTITKEQITVTASAYGGTGQHHLLAKDCPYIQKRLEELRC